MCVCVCIFFALRATYDVYLSLGLIQVLYCSRSRNLELAMSHAALAGLPSSHLLYLASIIGPDRNFLKNSPKKKNIRLLNFFFLSSVHTAGISSATIAVSILESCLHHVLPVNSWHKAPPALKATKTPQSSEHFLFLLFSQFFLSFFLSFFFFFV